MYGLGDDLRAYSEENDSLRETLKLCKAHLKSDSTVAELLPKRILLALIEKELGDGE